MVRIKKRIITGAAVLITVTFAFLGCSRITPENYKKLNSGMTYEEVNSIIGDPANCESTIGIKSCIWEEGDKTIDVKFLTNKVLLFSSENL